MPSQSSTQTQIDDLQSRIAFQEDALQIMSEQIAEQADDLRLAREHIHVLNQKLNEVLAQVDTRPSSQHNERPPHY